MDKAGRKSLRESVARCCGNDAGKQMCSNYGCRNIKALLDECDRLEQEREDRRTALGQEIRNTLFIRGHWVPKELASSDLILAVAKALEKDDKAIKRILELEFEVQDLRSTHKSLRVELSTIYGVPEVREGQTWNEAMLMLIRKDRALLPEAEEEQ